MAAIAGLVGAVSTVTQSFFEINTISIDNWAFKMFYKWTTTLLIVSSIAVTSKQFFGDPIQCDAGHASGMIDKDVLDAYCWMYSKFTVPREFKGQCSAGDMDGGSHTLVYNSYYQWVALYLIALSIVFYLPRVLWLSMEGGLMKFFAKGTRSRIIENKEDKEEILRKYFQHHVKNRYNVYFFAFVGCELMNLAIAILSFFLTDRFLNNRYLDYGLKVLDYYRLPPDEQEVAWNINPLCRTFPRVASCDYIRYGMGGAEERINALCILSLNMINDKVFYIFWWWSTLLLITSFISLSQSTIVCCCASFRYGLIHVRLHRYFHNSTKKDQIKAYIKKSKLGDWFVLYQLSKNLYRPFFMDFITSLSKEDEVADAEDDGDDVGDNVFSMMLRPRYRDSIIPEDRAVK